MNLRVAGPPLTCSLNNGKGVRYVIFCQGCKHHCPGCQNPETWDFNGGELISLEDIEEDRAKGLKTLAIVLGKMKIIRLLQIINLNLRKRLFIKRLLI